METGALSLEYVAVSLAKGCTIELDDRFTKAHAYGA
jgi:hypothetical protein